MPKLLKFKFDDKTLKDKYKSHLQSKEEFKYEKNSKIQKEKSKF